MNVSFKTYNKQDLFEKIDAIEIFRKENQVITKYLGRVINITNVSQRYEIFDIKSFLKRKISEIESNFDISYYRLRLTKGVQELALLSDKVTISDHTYYKSFFILNSSDKTRKLNFNLGLYRSDNNSFLIGVNNISFTKKHLIGVTEAAEDTSCIINTETFNEQIDAIKSLVGERVLLSNIKKIIIDKNQKINHLKFDSFKNQLLYSTKLTDEQYKVLKSNDGDMSIDAYLAFNLYMQLFRNQDSYVIKKETEKIIKITQCFIRNQKIDNILCLI